MWLTLIYILSCTVSKIVEYCSNFHCPQGTLVFTTLVLSNDKTQEKKKCLSVCHTRDPLINGSSYSHHRGAVSSLLRPNFAVLDLCSPRQTDILKANAALHYIAQRPIKFMYKNTCLTLSAKLQIITKKAKWVNNVCSKHTTETNTKPCNVDKLTSATDYVKHARTPEIKVTKYLQK